MRGTNDVLLKLYIALIALWGILMDLNDMFEALQTFISIIYCLSQFYNFSARHSGEKSVSGCQSANANHKKRRERRRRESSLVADTASRQVRTEIVTGLFEENTSQIQESFELNEIGTVI